MWHHPLITIASATYREALRNRLLWLTAAFLGLGFLLAEILGALALTEGQGTRAALLGALLRIAVVLMVSFFVVTSTLREFHEKGVHLVLSLPIPRWVYLAGKLLGFAQVAAVIALLSSLVLLLYAPWMQVTLWGISLACELVIVIGLCLLCLLTFNQVTLALCAAMSIYFAARIVETLELMTHGPFAQGDSLAQHFTNAFITGLAYLLPSLGRFSPSEWLVYHTGEWAALAPIAGQTAVYLVVLLAAGLFDLYRKSF